MLRSDLPALLRICAEFTATIATVAVVISAVSYLLSLI